MSPPLATTLWKIVAPMARRHPLGHQSLGSPMVWSQILAALQRVAAAPAVASPPGSTRGATGRDPRRPHVVAPRCMRQRRHLDTITASGCGNMKGSERQTVGPES
mmetsp:Transcript_93264/g.200174  ORF Transcript_93264/g.200174 Transcript_93264/m.200174 type:complete len:105 (-) Transcript_93264:58-372(-)